MFGADQKRLRSQLSRLPNGNCRATRPLIQWIFLDFADVLVGRNVLTFVDQRSLARFARTSKNNHLVADTPERRSYVAHISPFRLDFARCWPLHLFLHVLHVWLLGPVAALFLLLPTVLAALGINETITIPAKVALLPYFPCIAFLALAAITALMASKKEHRQEGGQTVDARNHSIWARQWQELDGLIRAIANARFIRVLLPAQWLLWSLLFFAYYAFLCESKYEQTGRLGNFMMWIAVANAELTFCIFPFLRRRILPPNAIVSVYLASSPALFYFNLFVMRTHVALDQNDGKAPAHSLRSAWIEHVPNRDFADNLFDAIMVGLFMLRGFPAILRFADRIAFARYAATLPHPPQISWPAIISHSFCHPLNPDLLPTRPPNRRALLIAALLVLSAPAPLFSRLQQCWQLNGRCSAKFVFAPPDFTVTTARLSTINCAEHLSCFGNLEVGAAFINSSSTLTKSKQGPLLRSTLTMPRQRLNVTDSDHRARLPRCSTAHEQCVHRFSEPSDSARMAQRLPAVIQGVSCRCSRRAQAFVVLDDVIRMHIGRQPAPFGRFDYFWRSPQECVRLVNKTVEIGRARALGVQLQRTTETMRIPALPEANVTVQLELLPPILRFDQSEAAEAARRITSGRSSWRRVKGWHTA